MDIALLRWINQGWSNPILDQVFPFLAGNSLFYLFLVVFIITLWVKGGIKERVFICMALLGFLCSELVVSNLKDLIARPRPFMTWDDIIVRVGKGGSGSMPSSHTSTWFALTAVTLLYYRRWGWGVLGFATVMGISRLYNGVHYPSDVLAGAAIGTICAVFAVYLAEFVWKKLGKYIPTLSERIPSLLHAKNDTDWRIRCKKNCTEMTSEQYLKMGYVLIGVMLLFRWWYLWNGKIELSEDEAYQWVWSKYLALSYFSKPLMIALTQWLGTHIWGDNMFGVRFFSPVLSAITSLLLLRFLYRVSDGKVGFYVTLAGMLAPLLAVGSILMTVDPLAVLFWTAAMVCGWKAVQENSMKSWCWMGVWVGMGFISKYSTPLLILSWAFFFALCKPARVQLRKPGIYIAFLISLVFSLPVLIWNWQNDWISYHHVVEHGETDKAWHFTLRFFGDFTGAELGLLNPVFFVMMVWAAVAFWKKRTPLTLYLFSLGGPLFAAYWLYTFHSRVLPNWIAPMVISLFALGGIYWREREKANPTFVRKLYKAGFILGVIMLIPLHESNLIQKVSGYSLPSRLDPLRRVRAWDNTAEQVNQLRLQLEKETGKPCFIVADHYGFTGQLSFEIPEAREALNVPQAQRKPLVFYCHSTYPENQFYFWDSYRSIRVGDNAIYVKETDPGEHIAVPPERICNDFSKVVDLGTFDCEYRGRVFRCFQAWACYDALPIAISEDEAEHE